MSIVTDSINVTSIAPGAFASDMNKAARDHGDVVEISGKNGEVEEVTLRYVRLRDVGGIIVCDFIDMETKANRDRVLQELRTHLARDRARTLQEDGEQYVRENPTKAVFTALGIGFVLGLIFRR